jgi:hypothetical protein
MNEAEIRNRVHDALGDTYYPPDYSRRLESHIRQRNSRSEALFLPAVAVMSLSLLLIGVLVVMRLHSTVKEPAMPQHSYRVNSFVEIHPDGSTVLCYPYVDYASVTRCPISVPLQIDAAALTRESTLRDGSSWTPFLEITGTWTGQMLVVKEPPKPGKPVSFVLPETQAGNASPEPPAGYYADQKKLTADGQLLRDQGIRVVSSGWSKAGFWVIVVVADQPAINHLKATYKVDLVVSWFKLVS